ncbi:hypothetical protein CYY_004812 [Polysphondylium violaceum]|uniref:Uncharacterized protein n=1 Tax=Polysphondylium violaceum TaxID=133409 RepID=A0A8J4V038_9MYCE|nr:hypothetical protein CYY_004812 [Polysphondylium violaceum]
MDKGECSILPNSCTETTGATTQPKLFYPNPNEGYIMRTWEDLKRVINEGRLHELGRRENDQLEMTKHMTGVKAAYHSIKDYIDHRFFDFPVQDVIVNSNVKKVSTRPQEISQKLVFRPNDFPYNCEDSVSHYVLWCLKPLTFDEAKDYLDSYLGRQYGDDSNGYIFFVNPEHLQSIKEIFHYHVFIRNL